MVIVAASKERVNGLSLHFYGKLECTCTCSTVKQNLSTFYFGIPFLT